MILVDYRSFSSIDFKYTTNVVTTVDGDQLQLRRIQSVKVGDLCFRTISSRLKAYFSYIDYILVLFQLFLRHHTI